MIVEEIPKVGFRIEPRNRSGRFGFCEAHAWIFLLFGLPGIGRALPNCVPVSLSAPALRVAGELDAKGYAERLASERGRVVLVNFWATWCVPCREEFPDLVRLAAAYGPRGLTLLGVSTDFESQRSAVERFLNDQKPSFPNYRKKSGADDQAFIEAVDAKWGGELPFSVLYDRSGRKIATFSGKHSYAEYEKAIAKLLKEGKH